MLAVWGATLGLLGFMLAVTLLAVDVAIGQGTNQVERNVRRAGRLDAQQHGMGDALAGL
jgi:predicted PurR-regulated permease PerM